MAYILHAVIKEFIRFKVANEVSPKVKDNDRHKRKLMSEGLWPLSTHLVNITMYISI